MEVGKLNVEYREGTRKSAVRRLRVAGKIPAVCYGQGAAPLTLSVVPSELIKALDPIKKTNTLIKMTVQGGPESGKELTVMVRDFQRDAIRGDLVHADFLRVSLDKEVHATIPIVLTGKPAGVKEGGILHQVIRMLEIAALPDKIPAKIEVDVTPLGMNEAYHVSDLKLGEGVRALVDAGTSVCSVTAPKAEKVEAAAEVVPGAEGAAAAPAEAGKEGAKAAAPAAGKGGAPAGKEGGEKKK
jgi:large subunit ribosomal protein L25